MSALLPLLAYAVPACAAEPEPTYTYVTQRGDTLIGISQEYLENPALWNRLQKLNRVREPRRMAIARTLKIPVRLLRTTPMPARVVQVQGDATSGGAKIEPGSLVLPGADIKTGDDGFVMLELPVGSQLKVQAQSQVRFDRLHAYPTPTGMYDSSIGLTGGRIDSRAAPQRGPGSRFEIHTPSAAAGVRGTDFRVSVDPQSEATRSEVLEGVVGVSASNATVPVGAGFGTVVEPNRPPSPPRRLSGAPDVSRLPALQERIAFRFALAPVADAAAYRARIAVDREFNNVVADVVSKNPDTGFSGLADGDYWLAVRTIDANGLEGYEARHPFRLKARPEPPFIREPQDRAVSRGSSATFAWTLAEGADRYHFQLARDPGFADVLVDDAAVKGDRRQLGGLRPAGYHWRVASVRSDGDHGPFSSVREFTQRAAPANPELQLADDKTLTVSWTGEPGQVFRFQIARDPDFASLIEETTLNEPRITRPKPGPGSYYVRTQATDPDGFVGPYSSTQRFDIPQPPPPPPERSHPWWLLLLPLLPLAL